MYNIFIFWNERRKIDPKPKRRWTIKDRNDRKASSSFTTFSRVLWWPKLIRFVTHIRGRRRPIVKLIFVR